MLKLFCSNYFHSNCGSGRNKCIYFVSRGGGGEGVVIDISSRGVFAPTFVPMRTISGTALTANTHVLL